MGVCVCVCQVRAVRCVHNGEEAVTGVFKHDCPLLNIIPNFSLIFINSNLFYNVTACVCVCVWRMVYGSHNGFEGCGGGGQRHRFSSTRWSVLCLFSQQGRILRLSPSALQFCRHGYRIRAINIKSVNHTPEAGPGGVAGVGDNEKEI